jgi:hypothetical protein
MAALKKSTVLSASAEVIRCQLAFTFASLDVNVSALPCAASFKSDSIRIAEQSDWLVSSVVDEYPRRQGPHIPEPVALALQYVAIRLHGESRQISVIFTRGNMWVTISSNLKHIKGKAGKRWQSEKTIARGSWLCIASN